MKITKKNLQLGSNCLILIGIVGLMQNIKNQYPLAFWIIDLFMVFIGYLVAFLTREKTRDGLLGFTIQLIGGIVLIALTYLFTHKFKNIW